MGTAVPGNKCQWLPHSQLGLLIRERKFTPLHAWPPPATSVCNLRAVCSGWRGGTVFMTLWDSERNTESGWKWSGTFFSGTLFVLSEYRLGGVSGLESRQAAVRGDPKRWALPRPFRSLRISTDHSRQRTKLCIMCHSVLMACEVAPKIRDTGAAPAADTGAVVRRGRETYPWSQLINNGKSQMWRACTPSSQQAEADGSNSRPAWPT